jgi:hypothetical protein
METMPFDRLVRALSIVLSRRGFASALVPPASILPDLAEAKKRKRKKKKRKKSCSSESPAIT